MAFRIGGGVATISSNVTLVNANGPLQYGYGAVDNRTLRTASQIGNANGAADFGSGNTSSQTLRVVLPNDQPTIDVDVVSSVLPTGAATEIKQDALIAKIPSLGQALASGSLPVVLASDQSTLGVVSLTGAVMSVKTAQIPVGTATRLTTDGLAPDAQRRRLEFMIIPPTSGSPNFYIGNSTVDPSNGKLVYPGTNYVFENCAEDLYICTDSGLHTVHVLEIEP